MAIEKEKLLEILNSDTDAEAKAENLLGMLKDDTASQLNAVLVNKEEILKEKREEMAKRKALEDENTSLKDSISQLQTQLEASSPDEVKKIYEKQLTEAATVYEKRISDNDKTIEAQKQRIHELEHARLKLRCMEEFNKAITGKNVASDVVTEFADFVLGADCCKFDDRPIGEGKTILATKDGQTIENAVKAALETSFGKRCVVIQSSGGGAEGGTRMSNSSQKNPFKTETFNLTEQAQLKMTNPELYERLKKEAGL